MILVVIRALRTLAAALFLCVSLMECAVAAETVQAPGVQVTPAQGIGQGIAPELPPDQGMPDLRGTIVEDEANDPFEPLNRVTFGAAVALDRLVSRPVALVYGQFVPMPIRDSVRNVLNNLNSPVIFVNDVLQGQFERASITFLRAFINSTFGIVGMIDVAQDFGLPRHSEDFGQTLAVYGVGEGPYIFLPVIGPGNPRDLIGRAIDFLFDPLTYFTWRHSPAILYARFGIDMLDLRERNMENLDYLEASSADLYASLRGLYRQSRTYEIQNGVIVVEDLPDF